MTAHNKPLFKKIDCIQIPVPDLDAGLAFYQGKLGHELKWRHKTQAGLRLGDSELVLQTERPKGETDLLVESTDAAVKRFKEAGGTVVVEPEDIPVGRVAVVTDPFGNALVILDLSKGTFNTDQHHNVTGVS